MTRSPAILSLVLLLPTALGCSDQTDLTGYLTDFEGRLTGDLQEMDGNLIRLAEQAAELPEVLGRNTTDPVCVETIGDCMICFDVKGGPLAGDFTIATDPAPCAVTVTSPRDLSATYTVAESALEGTYEGTLAGDYTIIAAGTRSASLSVETSRSGTAEYDATFEVTELTATTEESDLSTYSIAMTYTAFDDRLWNVDVDGTTTGILGTAASPGGVACSIDGTFEDIDVSCTGPNSDE